MSTAEPRMSIPKSASSAARNALQKRKELPISKRFGTAVGLARAAQLAAGGTISLTDARNIYGFLSRHKANFNKAQNKEDLQKVEGAVALWGGMSWFKALESFVNNNRSWRRNK